MNDSNGVLSEFTHRIPGTLSVLLVGLLVVTSFASAGVVATPAGSATTPDAGATPADQPTDRRTADNGTAADQSTERPSADNGTATTQSTERRTADNGTAQSSAGPAKTASVSTQSASEQVTLVTGHTVLIAEDGTETTYRLRGDATATVQKTPSGTYVIPAGVDTAKFDRSLFNVDLLRQEGVADGESSSIPLIVQWSNDSTESTRSLSASGPRRTKLESINGMSLAAPKDEAGEYYRTLAADPTVEAVHYDKLVNASEVDASGFDASSARQAFNVTGENVTVAVLDTGVNESHPALDDAEVGEIDLTGEGTTRDLDDHGTAAAGLIAGDGPRDNGTYRGVAPDAKILDVRVLDRNGDGRISDIIDGIDYAVENDADVISMSLGFEPETVRRNDPVRSAALSAAEENVTLVSSAGNLGRAGSITSPATLKPVIAVGSIDNGSIAPYSSRGPTEGGYVKPNLVAPGTDVTSTSASGGYDTYRGTSFAAPYASGTAALVRAAHPNWTEQQVRNAIVSSTDDVDAGPYAAGTGRLNATAALGASVTVAPATIDFGRISAGDTATRTVSVTNHGNESRTLPVSVSSTLVGGDESGSVSVNRSSLTLGPGESATLSVTVETAAARTAPYDGYLQVGDATAALGYVPERKVTVTKRGESVAGDQVTLVHDDSETVYGPEPFSGPNVTIPVDQAGEFTAISTGRSDGQPSVTVGTTNTSDSSTIVLDERETVNRTVDTGSLPQSGSALRNRTVVVSASLNDLPVDVRATVDSPETAAVKVTPSERTSYAVRRVLTTAGDGPAYEAGAVYHLATSPKTVSGPAATPVNVSRLKTQRVRYYRGTPNATYTATVAADNFDDVSLSESYTSSAVGDQFEQTIYVSPRLSHYHDAFTTDEFGFVTWSATPKNIIVDFGEDGETTTAVNKQPFRSTLFAWSLSETSFSASVFPTVGQPPNGYVVSDTPSEQYDIWVNGEQVRSETRNVVDPSFDVSAEDIESVRLRVRDKNDISPRSNTTTTFTARTNGSDDRPPATPSVVFDSLNETNVVTNGTASVTVGTSDADSGVDSVSLFVAPDGAEGAPSETPFQNATEWREVNLTATGNGTYAGTIDLTDYRGTLSVAANATDASGNAVETTATRAVVVGSRAPVASGTTNTTLVRTGDGVRLDAAASYDDAAVTEYRWDVDGDGEAEERTSDPVLVTSYTEDGVYEPTVTVVDSAGRTDTFEFEAIAVTGALPAQADSLGSAVRSDIRTAVQRGNVERLSGFTRGYVRTGVSTLLTVDQPTSGFLVGSTGTTTVLSETTFYGNLWTHNVVLENTSSRAQVYASGTVAAVGDTSTVNGPILASDSVRVAPDTTVREVRGVRTSRLVVGRNATVRASGSVLARDVELRPGARLVVDGQLRCSSSSVDQSASASVDGWNRCTAG